AAVAAPGAGGCDDAAGLAGAGVGVAAAPQAASSGSAAAPADAVKARTSARRERCKDDTPFPPHGPARERRATPAPRARRVAGPPLYGFGARGIGGLGVARPPVYLPTM